MRLRPAAAAALLALAALGAGGCAAVRPLPPPDYDKLVQLAGVYQLEGKWAQADPLLDQAVKSRPERPEAYALRADAAAHGGDFARAAEECRSSLARDPGQPIVLNNLAMAEVSLGHPDLAYAAVKQAMAYSPIPAWPFLDTLARVHAAAGRREEALAAARQALAQTPLGAIGGRKEIEDLIRSLGGVP